MAINGRIMPRCRGADPRRYARCPNYRRRVGAPKASTWGAFCTFASTTKRTTTKSSASYADHLTLTTPDVPAGTYWLGWRTDYQTEKSSADAQVRVQLDGSTTLSEKVASTNGQGTGLTDPYNNLGQTQTVTLSAGVHTFVMAVRRLGGALLDEVALGTAAIEFWQVA